MRRRLIWLAVALCLCCVAYMTIGVRGPLSFVIPFRGTKLAALILVGVSISTSTVLFQTVSQNRILTPSIMGFDALYVMILTGAVFFLGGMTVALVSAHLAFAVTACAMTLAALLLFSTLLQSVHNNLMRMILTGIVLGALFRALTDFMQRLIDPNEFSVIQGASFARFTQIETDLLLLASVVCGVAVVLAWRMRFALDVLTLGREAAVNLGLDLQRVQMQALILTAVLVAVSTALVGPVAFLGLLVVSLARLATPVERHGVIFISASLISAITLIGGQTVLERVFHLSTPLSVVIDLLGGALFLILLLKGQRR
ncbi:iron complex transport system permease protein [Octadecabacter temperatus]|uniref:Fe(3+) dicitrate transport system permease protein FecD n=1 Tax=Octadecabacter temperatus TaxID=1458307 RepID=A0A0K0Y634_9RHOB|nr:iron chelate uptake ABC transporter family permease subunit [Octadecabacter temperatus]AKS46356.1 Fe(3+) dicitrate transport system permease protein FecD [Octadecabacter temperatus]SIO12472.1 iron complex transport system permease protein [Octadecabacter temperatus]